MGSGEGGVLVEFAGDGLLGHELLAFSSHGGHHLFINRIPPRLPKEECEHLILEQLRLHPFVLQVSKCSVIPQNSLKNKGYGFITLNGSPSQADLKSIASSLNNKLQVGCRTLGVRVCTDCHSALLEEDSGTSSSQDSSPPAEPCGSDLPDSDVSAVDAQLLDASEVVTALPEEEGSGVGPRRDEAALYASPVQSPATEPASQPEPAGGPGPAASAKRRKPGKQQEHAAVAVDFGRPAQPASELARGKQGKIRAYGGGPAIDGSVQKPVSVTGRGNVVSGLDRRSAPQPQQESGGVSAELGESAQVQPQPPSRQPVQDAGEGEAAALSRLGPGYQQKSRRAASPTAPSSRQPPYAQTSAQVQTGSGSHGVRGPYGAAPPPPPPSPPVAHASQPQQHAPAPPAAQHHLSAHARNSRSPSLPPQSTGPVAAGANVRGPRVLAAPGGQFGPAAPPLTAPAPAVQEPPQRPTGQARVPAPPCAPSLHRASAPPALRYQLHTKYQHFPPHGNGGPGINARRAPSTSSAEAVDGVYNTPRQEHHAGWGSRRSGGGAPELGAGPGMGPPGSRGGSHLGGASAPHLHPHAQPGRHAQLQHQRHHPHHQSAGSAQQAYVQPSMQAHGMYQSPPQHPGGPQQHGFHYRSEGPHLKSQQQHMVPGGVAQQQQQRPAQGFLASAQGHTQQRPPAAQPPPAVSQPPAASGSQLWLGSSEPDPLYPRLATNAGPGPSLASEPSPLPLFASEPPGVGTWRPDGLDLEPDVFGRRSQGLFGPGAHGSSIANAAAPASTASVSAAALGHLRLARGSSDGLWEPHSAPAPELDPSDELDPLALEPMIMQLLENDDDDDYRPAARHSSLTQAKRSSMDWQSHQQHSLKLHHQMHAFGSVPVQSPMPELMAGPSSFGAGGIGGGFMAAWFANRSKSATGTASPEHANGGAAAHEHGVAAAVAAAWGQPPLLLDASGGGAPAAIAAVAAPVHSAGPRPGGAGGPAGRGLARESCGTLRVSRGGRGPSHHLRGSARPSGGGCFDVGGLASSSLPNASMLAAMQRRAI